MIRPKAILFDWDNTLVNSWPHMHASLSKTFVDMGREPWSIEEVKKRARKSVRDAFPLIFGEEWEKARDIYRAHFLAGHLENLVPLEQAHETLKFLAPKEVYVGIVSNKTGPSLRKEVEHLGWHPYFRKIVGAMDAPRDKPAIDPVLMALEGSGLEPGEHVWFVGDTDLDMECAENAGCFPVFFGDGEMEWKSEAGQNIPKVLAHHELITLLQKLL